jgi:putative transposase
MCRQLGIADGSYHRWKSPYGGMKTDAVRRLKELERGNDRLEQIVAELTSDKKVLQEAVRGD